MNSRRTILVVDDEAPVRRVLEIKLRNRGYRVILENNGERGLKRIVNDRPDVVITDVNMPKIDGKQLCMVTNELKKERTFLTIVITARIANDDKNWIAGMRDTVFMEKPFSPLKLMDYIDSWLGETG